jgi:hypothetical protein
MEHTVIPLTNIMSGVLLEKLTVALPSSKFPSHPKLHYHDHNSPLLFLNLDQVYLFPNSEKHLFRHDPLQYFVYLHADGTSL